MQYLTKNGIRFGENGLSKTCSCHNRRKTYYVTESPICLQLLEEYRSKCIK